MPSVVDIYLVMSAITWAQTTMINQISDKTWKSEPQCVSTTWLKQKTSENNASMIQSCSSLPSKSRVPGKGGTCAYVAGTVVSRKALDCLNLISSIIELSGFGKLIPAVKCVRYSKLYVHIYNFLKGALDNFSLIPNFFSKKVEIFISLEVYTYVVTAC